MNKLCEDCLKNDVCKYIDDFDKFVKRETEEADRLDKLNEVPNNFVEIEIKCKFRQTETVSTFREIEREDNPIINPYAPFYPIEPYPIITYYGSSTGNINRDNLNLK